jgi:hypothetical protein
MAGAIKKRRYRRGKITLWSLSIATFNSIRRGRLQSPVHAGGIFLIAIVICPSRLTNLSYFLPGLLTGHGTAITGRAVLAQFPRTSLELRLRNA